jgi:hypothetical protein
MSIFRRIKQLERWQKERRAPVVAHVYELALLTPAEQKLLVSTTNESLAKMPTDDLRRLRRIMMKATPPTRTHAVDQAKCDCGVCEHYRTYNGARGFVFPTQELHA